MYDIVQELRYALRRLTRSPLFTVIAVATLALAIGANRAVFSVVRGVLLKPLPFEEPERLVGVWHTAPGLGFELSVVLERGAYLKSGNLRPGRNHQTKIMFLEHRCYRHRF